MTFTDQEIKLIQSSWISLKHSSSEISDILSNRLVKVQNSENLIDLTLIELYTGHFMHLMNVIVFSLNDDKKFLMALKQLGGGLNGYSIENCNIVRGGLFYSLRYLLENEYNLKTQNAWNKLFVQVDEMIELMEIEYTPQISVLNYQ